MKKGIIEINRSCSEIESRYNKQSITIVMTMKSEVYNFYEKNKTLLVDWWWCIRHHVRRANKTQQRSYCNKINFCVFSTSREQSTWRPIKKVSPRAVTWSPILSDRGCFCCREQPSAHTRHGIQLSPIVVRIAYDPVKTSPEHFFPSRFPEIISQKRKKKES